MSKEWSNEEVEILKTMWNNGASATQIAHELPDRSRNAVLGQVLRSNMPKRTGNLTPRQMRAYSTVPGVPAAPKPPKVEKAPVVVEEDLVPMDPPITTLNLRDSHCKWPYDAPGGGYHYCGKTPKPGSPWCPGHHRKAYQPKTSAA